MKNWTKCLGFVSTAAALAGGTLLNLQACTFRTESKIETTSKIDAHIVLDIRQVKDEAGQVEGYVRGQNANPPPAIKNEAAKEPMALARDVPPQYRVAVHSWFDTLDPVSAAYAQGTPAPAKAAASDAEKKAIEARKARFEKIEQAMKDAALGENERGYAEVLLKAAANAKDDEKTRIKALQTLANEENADRKTIYLAAAQRAGGNAGNLPEVEQAYAEKIREKLKAGVMFQAPKDKKAFEDFQKSALGKLYSTAKAGDWLKKKDA